MATTEASRGLGPVGRVEDCKVLIAVQPPALERLIEHVLHGHPGLRVVGGSRRDSAARRAARLAPDVIIASTRLHGKEHGDVLADLKRSCPASTLILAATNQGTSGAASIVNFQVANADSLFAAHPTFFAFANLAGSNSAATSFDWGLPFFFGRNMFTAIEGRSTPVGPGPYLAY